MEQDILVLSNITKYYPGVAALKGVNLNVRQGEVHALVGENGAGKSTLIKTISGAVPPTEGTIRINGKEHGGFTPASAREEGIGVIYQEFNLVSELTVYENIYLGEFLQKGIVLDKSGMRKKAGEVFHQLNIDIDPGELVKNLTVGYQQMVEIAKAISKKVKLLIMDEPTAPLTNTEVESLFGVIRKLKKAGVTVIYISHRMEEIFQICDRVSVMRDGEMRKTMDVRETSQEELIRLMIGRELVDTYPRRGNTTGECPDASEQTEHAVKDTVLELREVCGNGLRDITFSLKKGEILGLGGLVGAGRTELAELIFGLVPLEKGTILLRGQAVRIKSPKDAIKNRISLIPEDRKRYGAILNLSVKENIVLAVLKKISRRMVIDRRQEAKIVDTYREALKIKTPSVDQQVNHLSGGNQQKVIFAKWIATDAEVLILDEPTRGIDVGAKYEIYQIMNELAAQGKALIMISSDMPELIGMSDRILVLAEGELRGELNKPEFSQEKIMQHASI